MRPSVWQQTSTATVEQALWNQLMVINYLITGVPLKSIAIGRVHRDTVPRIRFAYNTMGDESKETRRCALTR